MALKFFTLTTQIVFGHGGDHPSYVSQEQSRIRLATRAICRTLAQIGETNGNTIILGPLYAVGSDVRPWPPMKTPNLKGWEKLICPYFAPTCRRVLGQYLEANGFTETGLNEIGGIVFSRFGIFLEISYELELVPQALSVVLGIGDKKYDAGGHPCCVPYWYLIPRDRPEHRGEQIKFITESSLEMLLVRFKDEFLEPYAKPLWINLESLEKVIANFRSEFTC